MALDRTKGVDLESRAARNLFRDHVSSHSLHPEEIWFVKLQKEKGHTSDWARVNRHFHILRRILDIADGRIPKQAKLHQQFANFLNGEKVHWSFRDSDDAVTRLRAMLQSLLSLKRNSKAAPHNYERLQIIMDKLVVDRACSSSRSRSRSRRSRKSPRRTRSSSRSESRKRVARAAPSAPRRRAIKSLSRSPIRYQIADRRDKHVRDDEVDIDELELSMFKKKKTSSKTTLEDFELAPIEMHTIPCFCC